MKNVHEMNTEEAREALCKAAALVKNIVCDPGIVEMFREKLPEDAIKADLYMLRAKNNCSLIYLVLDKHKEDAYGVLAALNGATVEEIKTLTFDETKKLVNDLLNDKEILGFFV